MPRASGMTHKWPPEMLLSATLGLMPDEVTQTTKGTHLNTLHTYAKRCFHPDVYVDVLTHANCKPVSDTHPTYAYIHQRHQCLMTTEKGSSLHTQSLLQD